MAEVIVKRVYQPGLEQFQEFSQGMPVIMVSGYRPTPGREFRLAEVEAEITTIAFAPDRLSWSVAWLCARLLAREGWVTMPRGIKVRVVKRGRNHIIY